MPEHEKTASPIPANQRLLVFPASRDTERWRTAAIQDGWDAESIHFHDDPVRLILELPHRRAIRELCASGTKIGEAEARAIAEHLPSLTSLDLGHNGIGDAGARAIAEHLPSLTSLDLGRNRVGDAGARAIAEHLPSLTSLDLGSNGIGDAGARVIAEFLPSLTSLDLSANSIGEAGARVIAEQLRSLTSLNLGHNGIGEAGARAIAERLRSLTSLYLWANGIGEAGTRTIAEHLHSLTGLSLGRNGIGDEGARMIAKHLHLLTELSLGYNGIGDAGARVIAEHLHSLTSLHLWDNGIGEHGARAITEHLPALVRLDLDDNHIGDAGARAIAEHLPLLTSLELRRNYIGDDGLRAILDAFVDRESVRKLRLQDNTPSQFPIPRETLEGYDTEALLAAWRRAREAEQAGDLRPLNEAKVLVLGDEAVGKSSLVKYLIHGTPRDPSHRKTPGAEIHEQIVTEHWDDHESGIKLNVWDFGGQEIMHGTHRFFLTARSVYLLVLEARREDQENVHGRVHEWLRTIRSHGEDSPIIIVINKHEPPQELRLAEDSLRKEFPSIVAFIRTSCNDGEHAAASIQTLRETILDTTRKLPHVREPLVPAWRRVKDEIATLSSEKSVLVRDDFTRLCLAGDTDRERVTDPDEQRHLVNLLDDLGTVVIARDAEQDRDTHAANIHLLDPNWLTKAIYSILNDANIRERGGEFSREHLPAILHPEAYPESWYTFIIRMMQSKAIGLCYRIDDPDRERYLIPEALPEKQPYLGDEWTSDVLRLRYTYEYLPPALMPRLIVRAHRRLTDPPVKWRYGVLFGVESCQVLVRYTPGKKVIDLAARGDPSRRATALRLVSDDLESLHELYKNTGAEARLPLPDKPEVDVAYEHLRDLEADHGPDSLHRPEGAKKDYRVGDLLGTLPGLLDSRRAANRMEKRAERYEQAEPPESAAQPIQLPHDPTPTVGKAAGLLLVLLLVFFGCIGAAVAAFVYLSPGLAVVAVLIGTLVFFGLLGVVARYLGLLDNPQLKDIIERSQSPLAKILERLLISKKKR